MKRPHAWVDDRCRWCAMHRDWPGAREACHAGTAVQRDDERRKAKRRAWRRRRRARAA